MVRLIKTTTIQNVKNKKKIITSGFLIYIRKNIFGLERSLMINDIKYILSQP